MSDRLIELIKNYPCMSTAEDCFMESIAEDLTDYLLANGVTVQGWFSVNDRLPDTAERVLVCKTWNGVVHKPEYGYYQCLPNSKGCWYVLTDFGYYPQRDVTHWMPLPQPPKGA